MNLLWLKSGSSSVYGNSLFSVCMKSILQMELAVELFFMYVPCEPCLDIFYSTEASLGLHISMYHWLSTDITMKCICNQMLSEALQGKEFSANSICAIRFIFIFKKAPPS